MILERWAGAEPPAPPPRPRTPEELVAVGFERSRVVMMNEAHHMLLQGFVLPPRDRVEDDRRSDIRDDEQQFQEGSQAMGYVAARIIECVFIAAGIIFVLGVVGLRHDLPGADEAAFTLAAHKDWTFRFGPGLIVPWGNGLILGYLMYKSGLVPRRMAWFGLIGEPLLLFGNFGVLFDWWDQTGLVSLLVIPEFVWEAFLGIYCAIWGFRKDSPILSSTPGP